MILKFLRKYVLRQPKKDIFSPFTPPKPTVTCKCGWQGVGIQTRVDLPKDSEKPRCPKCKKDNRLNWGKYKASVKKDFVEELDELQRPTIS
jgi:hypothetical protein